MRPPLLAAAILLVALGPAGCSATTEAPEPSAPTTAAEPAPEPTEDAVADEEAEVVQVYLDFTTAYDTVLQAGNGDTGPVSLYLRSTARTDTLDFIATAASQGIVQEGSVTVDSVTVESLEDVPGGSATLRACIDASTYTFMKDGAALREPGGKVVSSVSLREQDGYWMIESMDPQPEETC